MERCNIQERQFQEAISRLEALRLDKLVISEFAENRNLFVSFASSLLCSMYELSGEELRTIRKWEQETGNLVYHVMLNCFEFGTCYSLLYVSKYEEEWELDNQMLAYGTPFSYVINMDQEEFSEYGSIEIDHFRGLIRRIC